MCHIRILFLNFVFFMSGRARAGDYTRAALLRGSGSNIAMSYGSLMLLNKRHK
jgi:hypothetical protein